LNSDLIMGFRFGVFFFVGGIIPNPLDIRFKKVSGLTVEITTREQPQGGQNLYTQNLPDDIKYGNLVLDRGMVVGSPLNIEFNATITLFKFSPSNILVTLFSENNIPLSAWLFLKTYPVKWATSDLDAENKSLVIDTMELAYTRMQILRI